MTKYDKPTLPLDLEILDAEGLHNAGDDLYITYNRRMNKYYLQTRTFNYDVEWDMHFEVSKRQAREIVRYGYAGWWINVPEEFR